MMNWRRPGAILTLILTLAACGSDPGFDEAVDFASKEGSVQFVNMMPQSPQVTVIHGRETTNVDFPVAQTVELRFEDRYDWRIAYIDSSDQEITVTQGENQEISENVLSVFFMMGSLEQPDIQIVDIPILTPDEQTDGTARISFGSNLTRFTMVDIYITDTTVALADVSPTLSVTSGTVTDVFETPSGPTRIRVTQAATENLLFDSGAIEFAEKSRELFGLVDDFGPNASTHVDVIRARSLNGSTMEDLSQSPGVRFGNYTGIENLSATLGTNTFSSVGENSTTQYQIVTAGEQALSVSSDADSSVVLETRTLNPRPGTNNTLYTFDELDSTETQTRSLLVRDFNRPIADRSLFKFVNGSNQNVDVYILDTAAGQTIDNTAPLLNDLTPLGTPTSEARSRAVRFTVTNSDGSETLATGDFNFVESRSYTLLFDASAELHFITD